MYRRACHDYGSVCCGYSTAVFLVIAMGMGRSVRAEPGPFPSRIAPVSVDSGVHDNGTDEASLVFTQTVDLGPDVPWIRVLFSEADLPPGSAITVTSLLDGASQRLDAADLLRWRNGTAFFNGSAVEIELIAGPRTRGNFLRTKRWFIGEPEGVHTGGVADICDETGAYTDDRTPSGDRRVGRLLPGDKPSTETEGHCTAFIIDTPPGNDKLHLTCGHCFGNINQGEDPGPYILQIQVPASRANCTINHPPPDWQFPIDRTSVKSVVVDPPDITLMGNDFAVFRCHRQNGVSTFQKAGSNAFPMAPPPEPPYDACITGCGADGTDVNAAPGGNAASCDCVAADATGTRNNTRQTATGPLVAPDETKPTVVAIQVDVCVGNSGSPIIIDSDSEGLGGSAIGILCTGGCFDGHNHGTSIMHPDLQAAIKHEKIKEGVPGAPGWWNDENCGQFYAFAKWDKPPAKSPPNDAEHWNSNWLDPSGFNITVDGLDVTVTLTNAKIPTLVKDGFIYLTGTSAGGGLPVNLAIRGDNTLSGQPDSDWTGELDAGANENTWSVRVEGTFRPQADTVVFTFTMPAGGAITHAWAGECCHVDRILPAMTEWGMAVMTLLVLAAGTIVLRRGSATVAT